MKNRLWELNQGGGEYEPALKEPEDAEGRVDDSRPGENSPIDSDGPLEAQPGDETVAAVGVEQVGTDGKENASTKKKVLFGAAFVLIVALIALFNGSSQSPLELDSSTSVSGGVSLSYPSSWEVSGSDSDEISISSEDGLATVSVHYYVSYVLPTVDSTESERYETYLGLMSLLNIDSDSPESLTVDGYPAYKVEYEEDSSDGSGASDVTRLVVIAGNNVNLITASCEKSGKNASDSLTLSNILDSVTVDVEEVKVTFKDGQGNEEEKVCLAPELGGLVVAPTDFTRDGYVIDGWSCEDEDVTVVQDATYGYVVDGLSKDTTLETVWVKGCTVTFEDGSGNALSKQTVRQGSSATAPVTPTKTGCTFIGWDKDYSNVETDMTVTATWGYGSGSYRVGEDIPAGEYKMIASGSSYYCVYPDLTKSDILQNGNFTTVSYVTLADGQLFELNRGSCVPVSSASATTTIQGSGIYKVGLDLSAGQYKLTQNEGSLAYYAVLSTVDATVWDNIVDNDNFENSSYVEVHDGQYLELSRCTATLIS